MDKRETFAFNDKILTNLKIMYLDGYFYIS